MNLHLRTAFAASHTFCKVAVSFSFVCIYHFLFGQSSDNALLTCFHLLAIVDNVAVNIGVQISVPVPAFSSLGFITRSGVVGSYHSFVFNFGRNCSTVFHSGWTILHFHQQCVRVRIFPHPCPYLFSGFFWRGTRGG